MESKKVKYDFVVQRNITILTGDSATGKTTLIDYIREFHRYGQESGVFVSCDCPCRTLDDEDWEHQLDGISGSLIFIDEGNRYLTSKRFAEKLQGNDNYFVIATRERLPMLPYSIEEIYGFRTSGKFQQQKKIYNELYHLYGVISTEDKFSPKLVITEDSNSGHEFFSCLSALSGVPCLSAGGKANMINTLTTQENPCETLLIVDGAAYGSEMKDTYEFLEGNAGVVLYAPESFEWLLLSTGVVPDKEIEDILAHPESFADSKEFVSWERFFTKLLTEKTKDSPIWQYTKAKLNKAYVSPHILTFVKESMVPIQWDAEE
ncbi:MAG: hypothetical protein ACSW8H_05255 [bacterium]